LSFYDIVHSFSVFISYSKKTSVLLINCRQALLSVVLQQRVIMVAGNVVFDFLKFIDRQMSANYNKKICGRPTMYSRHTCPVPGNGIFCSLREVNRTICDGVSAVNDFGIFSSLALTFDLSTSII